MQIEKKLQKQYQTYLSEQVSFSFNYVEQLPNTTKIPPLKFEEWIEMEQRNKWEHLILFRRLLPGTAAFMITIIVSLFFNTSSRIIQFLIAMGFPNDLTNSTPYLFYTLYTIGPLMGLSVFLYVVLNDIKDERIKTFLRVKQQK